ESAVIGKKKFGNTTYCLGASTSEEVTCAVSAAIPSASDGTSRSGDPGQLALGVRRLADEFAVHSDHLQSCRHLAVGEVRLLLLLLLIALVAAADVYGPETPAALAFGLQRLDQLALLVLKLVKRDLDVFDEDAGPGIGNDHSTGRQSAVGDRFVALSFDGGRTRPPE